MSAWSAPVVSMMAVFGLSVSSLVAYCCVVCETPLTVADANPARYRPWKPFLVRAEVEVDGIICNKVGAEMLD